MSQEQREVPVIEARGICKYFGAVTALEDVYLKLYRGEVLGVVGDNGAGKSTLMKILAGLYPPNAGQIFVDGKLVHFSSPRDAREMGIEMVYQDLALASNLRIDENIFLGRERVRRFGPFQFINNAESLRRAKEHLDKLKIEVKSVRQRVEELSGGQRQAVAIARATAFDAKVVIMDEPTAALAVKEVRMGWPPCSSPWQQGARCERAGRCACARSCRTRVQARGPLRSDGDVRRGGDRRRADRRAPSAQPVRHSRRARGRRGGC
jgi:simple sugar transport system ATP-binding protein